MTEESKEQEVAQDKENELKQKMEEFSKLQDRILSSVGKLLEKENIPSCVLCCALPKEMGVEIPIIFWRGDLLSATKLSNILKGSLYKQISQEIEP
jgi:hypothetical protein